MKKDSKILITGGSGMVGNYLRRMLLLRGYSNFIIISSKEINLLNQEATYKFFQKNNFEYVFHLAAKVGGIQANMDNPDTFLYNNMLITFNVLESARIFNVKKLINFGSSCIYPRECKQPMKESYLMTGPLEPTNEGYSYAKIAGLKLCEYYNLKRNTNFVSLMFPNIYGIGDNFDENGHVVSALIKKIHNAKIKNLKTIDIWGTGNARREFLYVYDVANAAIHFMENDYTFKDSFINVGANIDISIKDLTYIIAKIIGYNGTFNFDISKPDGMPKKLLDSTECKKLGWYPSISLESGLKKTYDWYHHEIVTDTL